MLSNYLRKHTKHKVNHVVCRQFYLNYPADRIDPKFEFEKECKDYDFYIFRIVDPLFIHRWLEMGILRPDNFIIKFHGSEVRFNPGPWRAIWEDSFKYGNNRIMYVTNGFDYSMSKELPFSAAYIPQMVDADLLWETRLGAGMEHGIFKVGHAPTNFENKQTEMFIEAMTKLNKKYGNIVGNVITKSPWKDTISAKGACHAIYDQMSSVVGIGAFGVNMIETLAMSQPCIGKYNNYTLSWMPQLSDVVRMPAEPTAKSLEAEIEKVYLEFKSGKLGIGFEMNSAGRKLVNERFDVKIVGRQWKNLLEFVAEGCN